MRLVQLGHRHVLVHLLKGSRVMQGLHNACLARCLIPLASRTVPDLSRSIAHDLLTDLHVARRLDKLALITAFFCRSRIVV